MQKKLVSLIMAVVITGLLAAGCSPTGKAEQPQTEQKTDIEGMSFDEIAELAKGTTVSFYGWGGDDKLNAWLRDVFTPHMKDTYDITMEIVPMDIDQILAKLSGELQAGKEDGDVDMIWINGENFKSGRENDMLYGPFLELLPNAEANLDLTAEAVNFDFAYPIEGYEAPYGKAQLVMIHDTAVTAEAPAGAEELLEFAKINPGKVTYPALPDFTGSAFVRNIMYEICGWEQFQDMEEDKETVREAIQPALEYLRELNPYLWNGGRSFPASSTQTDNMFMDGELVMTMTYDAFGIAAMIENGSYPATAQSFIFDKGMIGNTNYIAIAGNSDNKAGAIAAINEMISVEMQMSRYEALRIQPVVSYDKISEEEQAVFEVVEIGQGIIDPDELEEKFLPEMPAGLVPLIEEIWEEEVVGK